MSNDGDPVDAKSRTVGGRYRLLERIGAGGAGTVWRARDELADREVAVKEPRLPGDPDDEVHRRAAHRLYHEARAAARVDHPSAVSIHDVVVEAEGSDPVDGLPWIVMELVRGESLDEVLRRGPLEPAEAARIGLAVLGALRAAHAVGIVHRDVKPANVLLGPHGRVVLTDVGIAHGQGEESHTAGGESVGSLEFVAPEGMSGRGAGPASDLWSLGVLLYTAVEGRPPFRRPSPRSTLTAILAADPPAPRRAGPLAPLLARLLVRDPGQRPDATEAAAALEAVLKASGENGEADGEGRETDGTGGTDGTDGEHRKAVAEGLEPEGEGRKPDGEGREADGAAGMDGEDRKPVAEGLEPDGEGRETDGEGRTPAPSTARQPLARTSPTPPSPSSSPSRTPRPFHHRPFPLALLTASLAVGVWLGSSFLEETDSGAITASSATPWVVHPEPAMRAALALPGGYRESARRGGPDAQPRLVVYSAGSVDVRLTQWDRAPGAPMARAEQARATWSAHDDDARTRTTRTTFHGDEAALADTTYGPDESPTRVMELFVRTDDGRMYELRVDMPKGTAQEKQGTSMFTAARDRLEIESR
jgi:eukaryotic-like serine/threonine-protein kinase